MKIFQTAPCTDFQPLFSRVEILAVEILAVLVWRTPPGETQKDVGDEVVDAVADFRVGMLVVLNHPSTPRKGSKQEATILKAL